MSKLAKFKAKGSDRTKEEWEAILRRRSKGTFIGQFVEKGLRKNKGVIVRNENN